MVRAGVWVDGLFNRAVLASFGSVSSELFKLPPLAPHQKKNAHNSAGTSYVGGQFYLEFHPLRANFCLAGGVQAGGTDPATQIVQMTW